MPDRELSPAAPPSPSDRDEAPPPFLGEWKKIYLLVIGELAVTVVIFWLLTRWAS